MASTDEADSICWHLAIGGGNMIHLKPVFSSFDEANSICWHLAIGGGKIMHLNPVFSSIDSYLIAKEIIVTLEKSTQLFTKEF